MNGTPRVSVVMAAYNYGQYIADALHSVAAQTLTDWECIIVDDRSTDDTAVVVRSFVDRDPRFRYIRSTENQGVSAARNKGFALAKGEYVQLLDADDVVAPGKFALQAAFLDAHPEVSIVYSDHLRFTTTPAFHTQGSLRADEKVSGKAALHRGVKSNFLRINAVLFRRALVEHIGGFRAPFRYAEDWDFWLRAMSTGHAVHFLDDPGAMAGVRDTQGSLSKDLPAMRSFHLPVRQSLWVTGKLGLRERVSLLLRYVDFMWELLLVKREPVIMLPEGRFSFMVLVVLVAVPLLPFWLFMRLFLRR